MGETASLVSLVANVRFWTQLERIAGVATEEEFSSSMFGSESEAFLLKPIAVLDSLSYKVDLALCSCRAAT